MFVTFHSVTSLQKSRYNIYSLTGSRTRLFFYNLANGLPLVRGDVTFFLTVPFETDYLRMY